MAVQIGDIQTLGWWVTTQSGGGGGDTNDIKVETAEVKIV